MKKKPIETLEDLIHEIKIRAVLWAICIYAICYFLSHTSKSMWANIPIAVLLFSAFRILCKEVEFRWKVQPIHTPTYLSHLEKKQLSVDDPRLSTMPALLEKKREIGSPLVEAAINEFIDKILRDFVVDLWYSAITPDREAPELMRSLINDALGEISSRVKELNIVELLTRDMVELIGNHLDLYRKNQSAIGIEVMGTLSFEERDERLKHHLIASQELHPALISPESEYKVLQRLMGGLLAVVLRPREAQCPLVRCIGRELLTCLVMQPILNLASPGYINEIIEYIFLYVKGDRSQDIADSQSTGASSQCFDHHGVTGSTQISENTTRQSVADSDQCDMMLGKVNNEADVYLRNSRYGHGNSVPPRPADWARVLEAATQRRSEVLAPENLENMWTKGRNYNAKLNKRVRNESALTNVTNNSGSKSTSHKLGNKMIVDHSGCLVRGENKLMAGLTHGSSLDTQLADGVNAETQPCGNLNDGHPLEGSTHADKLDYHTIRPANGNKTQIKRSNSTSALTTQSGIEKTFSGEGGHSLFSEFYSPNFDRHKMEQKVGTALDMERFGEGQLHTPKLKCRVVGAYFEKSGSKSFAVYSISVTDAEKKTWFVQRRYRNFERLHRQLKDIPNYTLHLPPKRFLSSSIDDSFVHQRCIQLDQYLQDLLSIANVAEQHEVWDFLSTSSKNYSFGKSTSVMKTLAVNVDDAMDDILRQFKGVSDGLMRKVVGSSSSYGPPSLPVKNWSWNSEEINKHSLSYNDMETSQSLSDNDLDVSPSNEEIDSHVKGNGWHSDNELSTKVFPPRVMKLDNHAQGLNSGRNDNLKVTSKRTGQIEYPDTNSPEISELVVDPIEVPPEWMPPKVSVPLLNLVDKAFQLNRRGWLRRQVFWISKQILQLMMEDAIDDWLVMKIHWLRRDDVIASGIRWLQNEVLWPNDKFFLNLDDKGIPDGIGFDCHGSQASKTGSFEQQLEAARRASDVKKMILGGVPTALVSLVGHKQYNRCAKDIYYFIQSKICVKQLAFGILELLLVAIFPELRDVVQDVHKMSAKPL